MNLIAQVLYHKEINKGAPVVNSGGGGGVSSGTVTDFIFTNAAGVSGVVTLSTSTPTLQLSLGAITPTSVVASGTITGSNLSGTNTGDQTSIVGISGTKAQFNTAVTDGDIVYLDSTDTITGVKTMSGLNVILVASSGLTIRNPSNTFKYTLTAAAIAADRVLNLPLITASDTLAVLGLAQIFTGDITTSSGTRVNVGTSTAGTLGQLNSNTTSSTVPHLMLTGNSSDATSDTSGGVAIWMTHNGAGNRQVVFGATENYNNASASVFRFLTGASIATLDGISGTGGNRYPINMGTDTSSVSIGNNALAYNATLPGKVSVYAEANGVGININLGSSGTGDLQRWSNNSGTAQSVITSVGNAGIRRTTATAYLHLGAGTAAANTAPLKLTSGTVNTVAEDGAIEFDGTHFYGSVGSTRYQLDQQSGGSGLTQPQVMARGVFGGPF